MYVLYIVNKEDSKSCSFHEIIVQKWLICTSQVFEKLIKLEYMRNDFTEFLLDKTLGAKFRFSTFQSYIIFI